MIALRAGKTHRLPFEHARAIACLDDQLWIATRDDELVRTDFSGRKLGEPCGLPFAATAMFVPAPGGPPAAAWGSLPAMMLVDDFGSIKRFEAADADATFPLTARRHLIARGRGDGGGQARHGPRRLAGVAAKPTVESYIVTM